VRIAVLNNLRAGKNLAEVSRVLSLLRSYPDVLHIETDHAHALPEALAEIARQNVNVLVVNGGDGTLQFALTEILSTGEFERIPMIAPLRGGRTNMTALDLGARRNPVKGLRDLLEDARAGRLAERMIQRPVLRLETLKTRDLQYGMFFGAGVIQRAVGLTQRVFPKGKSQGVFGAGLVTAGLLSRLAMRDNKGIVTPDKIGILVDGEMIPHDEFHLVIASSLDRLFLRMNPFWGRENGGVRFMSMAKESKQMRSTIPGILRGKPNDLVRPENGYCSTNADKVELRFDCGFTIDGELFEPIPDEVVTITADRRVTFVRA
jgi:diacylglycerol kinase (ATP)